MPVFIRFILLNKRCFYFHLYDIHIISNFSYAIIIFKYNHAMKKRKSETTNFNLST